MNLYLHLPVVIGTVPLRAPPYSPFDPLTMDMEYQGITQPPPVLEGKKDVHY